jgi:hypothetical protein
MIARLGDVLWWASIGFSVPLSAGITIAGNLTDPSVSIPAMGVVICALLLGRALEYILAGT